MNHTLDSIHKASDFESWPAEHLSDAFWTALIRYQKHPNQRDLDVMSCAVAWAAHANHGLSDSFCHALHWCGLDLYQEKKRDDLPER